MSVLAAGVLASCAQGTEINPAEVVILPLLDAPDASVDAGVVLAAPPPAPISVDPATPPPDPEPAAVQPTPAAADPVNVQPPVTPNPEPVSVEPAPAVTPEPEAPSPPDAGVTDAGTPPAVTDAGT